MGWIVFEALLALAVMLALVWWTFRGRPDADRETADSESTPPDSRH